MRLDARMLPNGTALDYDLCIVGGGPAGLTLARQFEGTQLKVCILEAGDDRVSKQERDALRLQASGGELEPQSLSRWRRVGGTAAIWTPQGSRRRAMRAPRLDRLDFERRDWVPDSGWPFDLEHLTPFYEGAESMLGLAPAPVGLQDYGFRLDAAVVRTQFDRFAPASIFTRDVPRQVSASQNVTLVTNATVKEILAGDDGRCIDSLRAGSSAGHDLRVRGRAYVLAGGAIENVRLMLNSKGVGNQNDQVGRFFANRQVVHSGVVTPQAPDFYELVTAYDIARRNGRLLGGKLVYSEETLREHRMLSVNTQLWPRHSDGNQAVLDSLRAMANRRWAGYAGSLPANVLRLVVGVPFLLGMGLRLAWIQSSMPPQMPRGGWSRLSRIQRRFPAFDLVHQAEPLPSANNRIVLGKERDAFGLARARVELRWSDEEKETIRQAHDLIALQFERHGLARVTANLEGALEIRQPGGIHHHLGGTRMHTDPRHGVVDADSRVHGLENLYLAGASVFPTAGNANPTLTLLALTLRLGDYLKSRLV